MLKAILALMFISPVLVACASLSETKVTQPPNKTELSKRNLNQGPYPPTPSAPHPMPSGWYQPGRLNPYVQYGPDPNLIDLRPKTSEENKTTESAPD